MIAASVESTPELQKLVEKHGWSRVWSVGERVLGYPPTWEISLIELLQLKEALNNVI